VEALAQAALEVAMTAAIGAGKGERSETRLSHRSGCYKDHLKEHKKAVLRALAAHHHQAAFAELDAHNWSRRFIVKKNVPPGTRLRRWSRMPGICRTF
jgi:hypothetical protein